MESSKTYNKYWERWEWINSRGQFHREDGPAVEWDDGTKIWYKNSNIHREDGPAVEYDNGDKVWYQNGRCHREDGPAVEYYNGHKEWWINGENVGSPEKRREKEALRKENESNLI